MTERNDLNCEKREMSLNIIEPDPFPHTAETDPKVRRAELKTLEPQAEIGHEYLTFSASPWTRPIHCSSQNACPAFLVR
jgi:hypothetical protein